MWFVCDKSVKNNFLNFFLFTKINFYINFFLNIFSPIKLSSDHLNSCHSVKRSKGAAEEEPLEDAASKAVSGGGADAATIGCSPGPQGLAPLEKGRPERPEEASDTWCFLSKTYNSVPGKSKKLHSYGSECLKPRRSLLTARLWEDHNHFRGEGSGPNWKWR